MERLIIRQKEVAGRGLSSKKGAFQCLAYMHCMNAYTAERIRTKYLLPLGIEFTYDFKADHDRMMQTDTGWTITLGRGLDIYEKFGRFSLSRANQQNRRCKAFNVSINRTAGCEGKTQVVYIERGEQKKMWKQKKYGPKNVKDNNNDVFI